MAKLDYSTTVQTITGEQKTLEEYRGKVLLIVNTASQCGLTPQFEGLEKLWKELGGDDFVILGFPCNQFAKQDPGSDDEIAQFCQLNYGVSFPMHSKVKVNGSDAHPLFKQLRKNARGVLGSKALKWNFTKFLVGKDGEIVTRFAPKTTPEELVADIRAALSA
ncbi:MAG: glutathione peroxidase [Myxococcales bacterium]|nr:glutathione peroxidase [Myxococcales bacterium]